MLIFCSKCDSKTDIASQLADAYYEGKDDGRKEAYVEGGISLRLLRSIGEALALGDFTSIESTEAGREILLGMELVKARSL